MSVANCQQSSAFLGSLFGTNGAAGCFPAGQVYDFMRELMADWGGFTPEVAQKVFRAAIQHVELVCERAEAGVVAAVAAAPLAALKFLVDTAEYCPDIAGPTLRLPTGES
eukprot:SAG22_NODE_611_length_8586_cov_8.288795_8_plen_110_part_00